MDSIQMNMLVELMEVSFVVLESALYLNTHPNDERALLYHNNWAQQYEQLENMYVSNFGPLRNTDMSRYPWAYINEPWPWEINFINY
jgi:spore coat protein JB